MTTPPPQTLLNAVNRALSLGSAPWNALAGGRVNRLWRVGNVVVKQYQPDGSSPLFPNDLRAEAAALDLLGSLGLSPCLLAQGQGWIAYRHVPGKPWHENPTGVAHALNRLHRVTPPTMFRKAPNGSAQLLAQATALANLCTGGLAAPPPDPGVAKGESCLIHGDAVPGNIIADNNLITMIDWQCPAIGDPTEDFAIFLSPAMQSLYRGAPLTPDEITAFRAACPENTLARYDRLAPLYHWRMAAHCLWRAESGAHGYAQAACLELAALEVLTQKNP